MGDIEAATVGGRRRRSALTGAVAAVGILVLVGVALIVLSRLDAITPTAASDSTASPTTTQAARHDVWAAGTKTVTYRGVEVDVPRELPVHTHHCGTSANPELGFPAGSAVQLGAPSKDPTWGCDQAPELAQPIREPLVQLTRLGTAAGAAETAPSGVTVTVFSEPGVVVTVTGVDDAFAQRVIQSARIADGTGAGCAATRAAEGDSVSPATQPIVSGPVDGATVCVYGRESTRATRAVLRARSTLDAAAAQALLSQVQAAPGFEQSNRFNACTDLDGGQIGVVRFRSGDDAPRDVAVTAVGNGTCGRYFASRDGHAVRADTFAAEAMLTAPTPAP